MQRNAIKFSEKQILFIVERLQYIHKTIAMNSYSQTSMARTPLGL